MKTEQLTTRDEIIGEAGVRLWKVLRFAPPEQNGERIMDAMISLGSQLDQEPLIINLNDMITFKLTEHGKQLHRREHEEFWASTSNRNPPEYKPPTEDEEGKCSMQLWSFMSSLGPHIKMGCPNVIEDNTIQLGDNK